MSWGCRLSHRAGRYAQFATGPTRFSLYQRDAMEQLLDGPAPAFEIGFKVDDCDAAFTALTAAGATPAVAPLRLFSRKLCRRRTFAAEY